MAGLVGGIAFFLLGYLVYGLALDSVMRSHSLPGIAKPMEEFNWLFLVIGNLVFGFLFAYVFTRGANINSFSGGATAGAIIGFLIALGIDASIYATANVMTMNWMFLDILAFTIVSALAGGIIGWWLGRGNKVPA